MQDLDAAEDRRPERAVLVGVVLAAVLSTVELLPWAVDGVAPVDVTGRLLLSAGDARDVVLVAALLFAATAAGCVAALAVLLRLPVARGTVRRALPALAVLSLLVGAVRTVVVLAALREGFGVGFVVVETAVGALEAFVVLGGALYYVGSRRRIRAEEQRRLAQGRAAERARADLEREELRVRREVSRRLHGRLQQSLVLATWRVEQARAELAERGETAAAQGLEGLADALDELRESEVRAVAHDLYPMAADLDLAAALAMLADRLPPEVRLEVRGADAAATGPGGGAADLVTDPADRVLLLAVAEEGVTNALRHGGARTVRVTLAPADAGAGPGDAVRVLVDDDGAGLAPGVALSGLGRLRARVRARGGDLVLGPSPLGGARVDVRVPLSSAEDRGPLPGRAPGAVP